MQQNEMQPLNASSGEPRSVFDEDFGFRARLESITADVAEEWARLDKSMVRVWPEADAFSGLWAVFPLVVAGRHVPNATRFFPKTMAFFADFPGLYSLGFSCLGANSWLPLHCGEGDDLLRCHLPLEIPEPSGIEIRGRSYRWTPGKTFCFDDTAPHRSWNASDRPKVMLMVDFRKPPAMIPPTFDAAKAEAQRRRDVDYYHRLFPDWRTA